MELRTPGSRDQLLSAGLRGRLDVTLPIRALLILARQRLAQFGHVHSYVEMLAGEVGADQGAIVMQTLAGGPCLSGQGIPPWQLKAGLTWGDHSLANCAEVASIPAARPPGPSGVPGFRRVLLGSGGAGNHNYKHPPGGQSGLL
jgi:hypothetical protein